MPFSVRFVKRMMDIVISLMIFVPFLPLWVLIALMIKLEDSGPVLYRQYRVKQCEDYDFGNFSGPDENDIFPIYKFRTMREDAEAQGITTAVKDDDRVTRVGKFLRSTRLDEIPNLFSVLAGHMSIIGPRADRLELLYKESERFPYLLERTRFVKPGITGLAQIMLKSDGSLNGNSTFATLVPETDHKQTNDTSPRYKMYYDFAYQMRLSTFWSFLITDLEIIVKTPIVMFFKRNTI